MTWVDGEKVTATKLNSWMPTNTTNSYTYLVRKNGSDYEAYSASGLLTYGGSIDAGGVDGADAAAVIQAVFNTNPQSVFFKAATYDLNGMTLTCASPVILFGDGNSKSIFKDGTINITEGTWADTGTFIHDLQFEVAGNRVALHFTKVITAYIQRVHITKTSYSPDVPSLWLTSCDTFRIEDNWFDMYQMQIIRIDGNESKSLPVHIIERNDFGSTAVAFPAYTDPWQVAAIYIADATQEATFIKDNIGYLNSENTFVYSIAPYTWVVGNNIGCGKGKYTVDLLGGFNMVQGNYINAADGSLGAIRFKTGVANDRNSITNNHLYMGADITALSGLQYHSVISDNVVYFSETGFDLTNCAYNIISNNVFLLSVAGTGLAINEAGTAQYNLFIGNYFGVAGAYLSVTAAALSVYNHNFGYVSENNGASTGTGAQQTIAHGCNFTPSYDQVFLSERSTGGALAYQSAVPDAVNIYITAVNGKTYNWKVTNRWGFM